MSFYDIFIDPFHYIFMKRALMGCLALALGCGPMGVFLVLRRMSLMGDALSHSILPGAAVGYIVAGFSLPAMCLGGMVAGLIVALLAGLVSRHTVLKEDASFAGFFLIAFALGIFIISVRQNNVDLIHILFGSVLAIDGASLILLAATATATLLILAIIYRPLVLECFDSAFFASLGGHGSLYHLTFVMLVVLNLVAGFQALGSLMALGIMMLPAIAARFWTQNLSVLCLLATAIAIVCCYFGTLFSYHYGAIPSGPAIILFAGFFYVVSLLFGRHGSVLRKTS